MNKLKIFLAIIIGFIILSSCRKEVVQAPVNTSNKPQNMNELVATPTFDWKTTKDFQFTFIGSYTEVVTIKSASGVVFHKGFMKANNNYKINLTLPASEKTVHLIYHGQDIVFNLNQQILSYSFNSKTSRL